MLDIGVHSVFAYIWLLGVCVDVIVNNDNIVIIFTEIYY